MFVKKMKKLSISKKKSKLTINLLYRKILRVYSLNDNPIFR